MWHLGSNKVLFNIVKYTHRQNEYHEWPPGLRNLLEEGFIKNQSSFVKLEKNEIPKNVNFCIFDWMHPWTKENLGT